MNKMNIYLNLVYVNVSLVVEYKNDVFEIWERGVGGLIIEIEIIIKEGYRWISGCNSKCY